MIRKVKFSNFYSFYKEHEITFLTKKKKTYDYYQSKSGDQITKIASFIGGNASGKTNIMRFFSFLGYFACRNINNETNSLSKIANKTFFNNLEPSKFYIEFETADSIFFYSFSIKKNEILNESLHIKKIEKGARKVNVFSRQSGIITELDKNYFKNISIKSLPDIRNDVSFIAFIKMLPYNIDIINVVYSYFLGFKTNINERGETNHIGHQFKTLDTYLKDPEIKKEMENFISNFDLGLNGFDIIKKTKEEKFIITVNGIHATKEKNKKLDFIYESRGTQFLFFIIADILSALKNNSILIIDEIETGFHPEALNKLISYFVDENKDKKAQLFFSSHSFGFMNKLDIHQIYLTTKNNNSESSTCRLNNVKGIRTDENYLSKYMTGSYGAFPKIRV